MTRGRRSKPRECKNVSLFILEKYMIIWIICRRNSMHTSNNNDESIVGSWGGREREGELEEREKGKNVELRVDGLPGKNGDSSRRTWSIGWKLTFFSEKWMIGFPLCGYMPIWCGPSFVLPQGHNWVGGKFKKTCWAHFWKRKQYGSILGNSF